MRLKRLAAWALALLCAVGSAAAEGVALPENVRLAEGVTLVEVPSEMPSYTVAMRDMLAVSSEIPEEIIASWEEHWDGDSRGVTYQLESGAWLTASFYRLMWSGVHGDEYSQLLTYLRNRDAAWGHEALGFMSVEEAAQVCRDMLDGMGLEHAVLAEVQSLSRAWLEENTEEMAQALAGMKFERFDEVTEADEAYRLLFQTDFDGYPAVDGPEIEIVLRADQMALMRVERAVEHYAASDPEPVTVDAAGALALFAQSRGEQRSDRDEYEITGLQGGYALGGPFTEGQGWYVPCWRLDYTFTAHFGDQSVIVPGSVFYSMIDGSELPVL